MKVSLNLRAMELPEDIETFRDLLHHVETAGLPDGEVITRIVVDGDELDEDREQKMLKSGIGNLGSVEFYSARPLDLAREGLSDATELLPGLEKELPDAASELRAGNVRGGLEMFSRSVEVISWYVSLVTAVSIMFREDDIDMLDSNEGGELTMESVGMHVNGISDPSDLRTFASIENLRQKLIEIEDAQQGNDSLQLADLIEYELLPIIRIWRSEVATLLSYVTASGASA